MSLDYAFVKFLELPTSIDELEWDPNVGLADYTELAEQLFPLVMWQGDGSGIATAGELSFELRPSEASLSLSARGPGDVLQYVQAVALDALQRGAVTIDVQTSELLAPDACEAQPEYASWYRSVIDGTGA